jgi:hypothetical protein
MLSPESGEGGCIMETKESFFSVFPVHHVVVSWFLQYTQREFPKLGRGRDICCETRMGKVNEYIIVT